MAGHIQKTRTLMGPLASLALQGVDGRALHPGPEPLAHAAASRCHRSLAEAALSEGSSTRARPARRLDFWRLRSRPAQKPSRWIAAHSAPPESSLVISSLTVPQSPGNTGLGCLL